MKLVAYTVTGYLRLNTRKEISPNEIWSSFFVELCRLWSVCRVDSYIPLHVHDFQPQLALGPCPTVFLLVVSIVPATIRRLPRFPSASPLPRENNTSFPELPPILSLTSTPTSASLLGGVHSQQGLWSHPLPSSAGLFSFYLYWRESLMGPSPPALFSEAKPVLSSP